jgi:beta-N-acetylhexosaminidase
MLRSRELLPFRAAIAVGTKAVMSAHIVVPALDADRPGTLSRTVLTGLLREELGYDGLIVTDGIEMRAVADTYGIERGTVLALAAGADAICVGGGLSDEETVLALRDAIVTAVRVGDLEEQRLAEAAARVRELAEWTVSAASADSGSGAAPGTAPDPEVGLTAARRALRVTGTEPYVPPATPPYVAAFTPVANIAVGAETPWGIAAELERLLPGTVTGSFRQDDDLTANVLRLAGDRRIIAVVRDVHRHRWMAEALGALLAARPDTVVVEMGVPQAAPSGALHIATHGAARVCGRAAAEVIAGRV